MPDHLIFKRFFVAFVAGLAFSFSACTFHPEPLSMDEISQRAEKDLTEMFADQEPLTGEISLYEAMARAIKYNLDYRLQLMEKSMAGKILNAENYDLLPQITANAGYNARSEFSGASSKALTGETAGEESLVTSTSQEKDIRTADVSVMWNVLDFGIGYFRAKQNADNIMVSEEIRRKVIQNIIQDIQYAYWRAVGIDQLLNDTQELLAKADLAFEQSEEISGQKLQPKLQTLIYQRELLNNIRILWELTKVLVPAKTELATLMNLKPGTQFILQDPGIHLQEIPVFTTSLEDLKKIALIYRPELREADYKARISDAELRKTYISMMPVLNLHLGYFYDSNSFLYTNDWYAAGAQASLNLINFAAFNSKLDVAKTRQELDALRRKTLAIGVLAQVQISMQLFDLAKQEFLITSKLEEVDSKLSSQMQAERSAGRVTTLAMIQTETDALVSRVRHQIAYAELQKASAMIYSSIGIDLMPEKVKALDVDSLAAELEESLLKWEYKINSAAAMDGKPAL